MNVDEQIKRGKLVCPHTHQPLTLESESLVNKEGSHRYPVVGGVPVFIRKERGALKLAQLETRDAEFDLGLKRNQIRVKVQQAINTWNVTMQQYGIYSQTVRDYGALLKGERTMFSAGESSLFLVNRRELGYIQAQLKLVNITAKNKQAALKTYYALGILKDQTGNL